MGMYTQFRCKIRLDDKHTPHGIINFLRDIVELDVVRANDYNVFHPFFNNPIRVLFLFNARNNNTENFGCKMYQNTNGAWVLEICTEFKNYDNEIELFLDWIKRYAIRKRKRQYIGWYKFEMNRDRTYIFFEKREEEKPKKRINILNPIRWKIR